MNDVHVVVGSTVSSLPVTCTISEYVLYSFPSNRNTLPFFIIVSFSLPPLAVFFCGVFLLCGFVLFCGVLCLVGVNLLFGEELHCDVFLFCDVGVLFIFFVLFSCSGVSLPSLMLFLPLTSTTVPLSGELPLICTHVRCFCFSSSKSTAECQILKQE